MITIFDQNLEPSFKVSIIDDTLSFHNTHRMTEQQLVELITDEKKYSEDVGTTFSVVLNRGRFYITHR